MMQPNIETKDAMHFIGVSELFISIHSPDADNFQVIPALWGRVCETFEKISDHIGDGMYGVLFSPKEKTRPDQLRYIAGVRLAEAVEAEGLVSHSTAKAQYAVAVHKGPITNLGTTLRAFNEWLGHSDHKRAPGAEIEFYPPSFQHDGEDSVMETWVPVVKK